MLCFLACVSLGVTIMDPFQIRLRFIATLEKLNASQPTIRQALSLVVEHAGALHVELWDCIMDECRKGSLNRRVNLLFLIDSIVTDDTLPPGIRILFAPQLERDLYLLVDLAVPESRWDATLNLPTVRKILANWRQKLVIDSAALSDVELLLNTREQSLHNLSPHLKSLTNLSHLDMTRRIEEDRERHKRLRESSWILPPTAFSHNHLFGTRPQHIDPTFLPHSEEKHQQEQAIYTPQDLDFAQNWDETSDFNEDDVEEIHEQLRLAPPTTTTV